MRHAAELTGAAAAVAARAAYAALRRNPPAGEQTWSRTNHRGEPVTLLEGPAVAVGAIAAELGVAAVARLVTGPDPAAAAHDPERSRGFAAPLAISLAGAGALGFGVLDDLKGSGNRRGLRGHLGALKAGEVTTGTIKLAGLAATGLAASALLASGGTIPPRPPQRMGGLPVPPFPPGGGLPVLPFPPEGGLPFPASSSLDLLINAGLVAGGANLLNLFDLRPGRAIKVAVLSSGLIAGLAAGASDRPGPAKTMAPLGAALALLPEDLAERSMLGDAGANALGAMLGAAAAVSLPRGARAGLLAGIVALTVASEKVSFTQVIERNPALRWLDMLGRRPASPPGKHRRVRERGSAVRSAEWVFRPLKIAARQEP